MKPQGNEAVGDAISGVSRLFAAVVVATMALFLIAVWGMVPFHMCRDLSGLECCRFSVLLKLLAILCLTTAGEHSIVPSLQL